MTEFEVEHDDSFTVVTNNILRNKELSMSAKGLLCTIFSLPPEWDYSFNGLVAICKEGKAAVRNSINELKEAKYIKISQYRNEKGYYQYKYTVYRKPYEDKQINENYPTPDYRVADYRRSDYQKSENQPQLNTNKLNTNNNKIIKESNTKVDIDIFEDILKDIVNVELRNLYVDYIEMRRIKNKPLTKRGLKMLITRCERLSNFNIREQKQMLEAAIINNWNSVYILNEIKEEREENKQRKLTELKEFYED